MDVNPVGQEEIFNSPENVVFSRLSTEPGMPLKRFLEIVTDS